MKYIIDEKTLIRLITASLELDALNCGGVDNWEWTGESCSDALDALAEETGLEREDLEFKDVAKATIGQYAERMI